MVLHDKSRLTSIIIRTCHELKYIRSCIESVFKNTDSPFELILVNNGLSGPTVDYLKSVQNRYGDQFDGKKSKARSECTNIQLVLNGDARGSGAGKNQGLTLARGRFLLLLNSDAVVTPGWLKRMITAFEHSPKIGIVGPRSNDASGPQRVESVKYDIVGLGDLDTYAEQLSEENAGRITSFSPVDGFCMLIKRKVIEKIGGFDTRFGIDRFENDDFSLRADLACFESCMVEDSFVHNYAAQKIGDVKPDDEKHLYNKWELFKIKWGLSSNLSYGNPIDLESVRQHGFNAFQHFIPLPAKEKITEYGSTVYQTSIGAYPKEDKKRVRLPEYDPDILVSIMVPASGVSSRTQACLSFIAKNTQLSHEIIIVACRPEDKISEGLKWTTPENIRLRIVPSAAKRNPAQCLNAGIEVSRGQYLVMMRDDVRVTNGWIDGLIEAFNRCGSNSLVEPLTSLPEGRQQDVLSTDINPKEWNRYADNFRQRYRYRTLPAYYLSGFCLMTRRNIVENIGLFDENHEKNKDCIKDFCLRACLSGFNLRIAADVWVGGNSNPMTDENRSESAELTFPGRRYYREKWQGIQARSELGSRLITVKALEKSDRFYQMDKTKDAADILLHAMKYNNSEPCLYVALAKMLIDTKRHQDALDVLNHIPDEKTDLQILAMKACCKEGLGLYEEATGDVQHILEKDPSQGLALNLKGILAYRGENLEEAARYFVQAMTSAPDLGEPHVNYGYLLWESQDRDNGLNLIEKGFILDPLNSDHATLYHSAIVQCRAYARAEAVFKDACDCYPFSKRLTMLWIDTLIKQGKHETALNLIENCLVYFDNEKEFLSAALEIRKKLGPKKYTENHKNSQCITLCMIVKDEKNHLARCLNSVKGLVDEIIVVDTGSKDRTKQIAAVFGAKVFDIEWTHDFSKARNFSLSKATGNWIVILDADEVIAATDICKLKRLVEEGPRQIAYAFTTRNYYELPNITGWVENDGRYPDEEAGTGWKPSTKVRLFPNNDRIVFENAVHELVEYSVKRLNIKIRRTEIPIHHYGKLNTKKTEDKGTHYYKIGEDKLKAKGDLQALAELAVQASELGDHQKAMALWDELLEKKPDYAMGYLHISNACMELGYFTKARDLCAKAMSLAPDLKEAALNRAVCEMNLGNVNATIQIMEELLARIPDYPPAIGVLSTVYCLDGNHTKAMNFLDKLRKMGYNCPGYIHKRASQLINLNKVSEAAKLLEMALNHNYVSKEILDLIAETYRIQDIGQNASTDPE